MKLELQGVRVNKCVYENHMGPNSNINLSISSNSQIKLPKEFKKGSVGTIITKIMIGSPLQPLYIYIEQVTNYVDLEADENTSENLDTMMSIFNTVCLPIAHDQMEKTVSNLCKVYNIPEIKLQKQAKVGSEGNKFLN